MLLTIAQKNYVKQPIQVPELRTSLSNIAHALKAFESQNRQLAVKTLFKAAVFLPRNAQGLKICADIMESFMEMQAYDEAVRVARDMEAQSQAYFSEDKEGHFALFRIFANAAEAHEALGNASQARRLSKIALDHQLETQEKVDVEMLHLFMKQAS
jgi:hypothetical protein